MAPNRETLLATATAFSRSYDSWTVESALAVRAPDCVHQIHPASLGRPLMRNDGLVAFFASIKRLYQDYVIKVLEDETVIDVEKRTVVMHATGDADTILGKFHNEYIFLLKMDDEGTKIVRIDEFVDSAAVKELVPRIKAEWEKMDKENGKY